MKMNDRENEIITEQMSIAPEVHEPKSRKKLLILIGIAVVAVIIAILISASTNRKPSSLFTAMNTESSVYEPNKMGRILISTVGKEGNTLCNSKLTVQITDPQKFTTEISTENGSITTSTTCVEDGSKTNSPDYQTSFVPQTEGTYKLKLTNLDTKEGVLKKIEVKNDISFNIERYTTTRVNPSETVRYHMVLRITSKNDFKGRVVEIIPQTINIAWKGEAKTEPEKIVWEVDIKAGETKELTYDYTAPKTDGNPYDFGPITIFSGVQKVFEEKDSWQIVIGKSLEQVSLNFPSLLQLLSTQYF